MIEKAVRLKSGDELAVACREPPLGPETIREVSGFVARFLREEALSDILAGVYSQEACFIAGTGRIRGELVGTCWSGWGRRMPEIAVMGGVGTDERRRGQGIASAVVAAVCEEADRAGGRLLYLGTTNPAAQHIYEKLGFRPVAGHVFCRRRDGAAERDGLAPGQPVAAAPAGWGDMAAIVPLMLMPHPCTLIDAGTGVPSTRVMPPWRCVRLFWETWLSIANGGCWQVLRTSAGWVVASAVARRQARNFSVDFCWHPDYSTEALDFVRAFVSEREAETAVACEMLIGEGDNWKLGEAGRLGFGRPVRTGRSVDLKAWSVPLLRLTREA